MNILQAVERLKRDELVQRHAEGYSFLFLKKGLNGSFRIYRSLVRGECQPWTPTVEEMLATDWDACPCNEARRCVVHAMDHEAPPAPIPLVPDEDAEMAQAVGLGEIAGAEDIPEDDPPAETETPADQVVGAGGGSAGEVESERPKVESQEADQVVGEGGASAGDAQEVATGVAEAIEGS